MSRDSLFWGLLLLIAGATFLGNNLGYFSFDLRLIWPLFIVLLGVYILLGQSYYSGRRVKGEQVILPLDGASEAIVHIEHGAGSLRISGASKKDELLNGTFHNVDASIDKSGNRLSARLRSTLSGGMFWLFPWNWGHRGHEWNFSLNADIPLTLDIETGASDNKLDLSQIKLHKLDLDTGASSTSIILPKAGGHSRVEISCGAASMNIEIPVGVAADIRSESGLADISIDEARFPRSGKHYISPDYDSAANKVDLRLETGVSSVKIR
jgi:hypothetical protein